MVVCLYGLRVRGDADRQAEEQLFDELLAEARTHPGFIGYHVYTAEDGEELGVIRFQTRDDFEAWRNDPTHRAAWGRAGASYTEFWVQNCETFREYRWQRGEHIDEDLTGLFRFDQANLAKEG